MVTGGRGAVVTCGRFAVVTGGRGEVVTGDHHNDVIDFRGFTQFQLPLIAGRRYEQPTQHGL